MKKSLLIGLLAVAIGIDAHAEQYPPQLKEVIAQESIISDTQRKLLPSAPASLMAESEHPPSFDPLIVESPCVVIHHVALPTERQNPRAFNRLAQSAVGHCLGSQGLAHMQRQLQNQLIARGYITSRVRLVSEGRAAERLTVDVDYGRIGQLNMRAGSSPHFHPAFTFPLAPGEVLDLRRVEQGLENIGLIPGVLSDIRIVPGARPGESDIEIFRRQDKYWRVTAWLDDAGTRSTGRYQAGGALYLDNLAGVNDVLYASAARSIFAAQGRDSASRALYYSLPLGFWSLGALAGDSRYQQTINGHAVDYRYLGRSEYWGMQARYTLARGMNQKTMLNGQLLQRSYRYYLNDTEIALQRASLTSLKLGASHLHYTADAQISLAIDAVVGSGADNRQPMMQFAGSVLRPFTLSDYRLRYLGELSGQIADAMQPVQDKCFIGDRSTVRGFRGDNKLIGSNGGYLRNTLMLELNMLQPYVGVDYGQLRQHQGDVGGKLAGGVFGIQTDKGPFFMDIFAGMPLIKPAALPADRLVLGFSSQIGF